MASQCILYNPDDLAKTAQAYQEASNGFATAKSAFVKTGAGNPGFGLFMMALYPPYIACKIATQGYLGNIGQMAEKLSTALQGASEDSQQVECKCQDRIDNLQKQIDEHGERLTALENKQHDSDVIGGGAGGTGTVGGGGVVGGGGSADSSGASGMHSISGTRQGAGAADAVQPTDQKTKDTINTVGIDTNGDAKDDYSLNLTGGDIHATVLEDGSIKLSKRDSASVPMPPGANAGKSGSFSIDADHDGKDDVSMTPDAGADARISIFDKDDSKYAAIDFDNDGDYDAAVRIGDSEMAREAMRKETEESVWRSIVAKDPLGRTADELKSLYQDRDIVELPQRSEIK